MPRIGENRCLKCGCDKAHCHCGENNPRYEALIAPFYYEGGAKHAILKLKHYPIYAEGLAAECYRVFQSYYGSEHFDMLCPVPMAKRREKQSGFNHSAALAKELAQLTGVPYAEALCVVAPAASQHTRDWRFRAGNVRGIYDIIENTSLEGKTVLLVDDIKTSGATLGECALMLKLGGAKAVYAICAGVAKKDRADSLEGKDKEKHGYRN